MATIKSEKIAVLRENFKSATNITFADWLEREAANDPEFYRFLFDSEYSDEQREAFEAFVKEAKYIVLEFADDLDNVGYITHRHKIDSGNLCETYDNYGQVCGCHDAGCYTLMNSESSIHSHLLLAIEAEFGITIDSIEFCDIDELIDLFETTDVNIGKLRDFAEAWLSKNESHTQCSHFTYWDGRNFKSLVIGSDWSECDEEKFVDILSGFTGAIPVYNGASASETVGKYTYTTTRYSNDPWLAVVSES